MGCPQITHVTAHPRHGIVGSDRFRATGGEAMEKSTRRALPCTALRAAVSPVRGVAWRPAARRRDDDVAGRVELAIWDAGVLLRAGAREIHLPWPAWDRVHDDIRANRTPASVVLTSSEVLLTAGGRMLALTHDQWAAFVRAVRTGLYADT